MKFRCKQTGTIIEFKEQHDIECMLLETGYEVVEEKEVKASKKASKVVEEPLESL